VQVPVDCGEDVDPNDCPPSAETFVVAGLLSNEAIVEGPFGLVADSVVTSIIAALAPAVASRLEGQDAERAASALHALRGETTKTDEVTAWYDLVPAAKQMMDMMDSYIVVLVVIIYTAVFLIIMATILMATLERTREFGVMGALGMHRRRVVSLVLSESALIAVLGIVVGLALGLSAESYFVAHGMRFGEESMDFSGITIDPTIWPRIVVRDVVSSSICVFVMTTLAGLVPAVRASLLRPTEALRAE